MLQLFMERVAVLTEVEKAAGRDYLEYIDAAHGAARSQNAVAPPNRGSTRRAVGFRRGLRSDVWTGASPSGWNFVLEISS